MIPSGLSKYFKKNKDRSVSFLGDKMEIYISKRFEKYGCLSVLENVQTLALFKIVINDTEEIGYYLPAIITMVPSEHTTHNEGNQSYVKLTFNEGDLFMKDSRVVMNQFIGYVIFYELVVVGKKPDFLTYDDMALLFKKVEDITGINFRTNQVVYETIFSHLFRDNENIMLPFRLTNMKSEPVMVPLRSVAHAATSTSGKIIGSFFDDAINSAIVNQSENNSVIEDLLRL